MCVQLAMLVARLPPRETSLSALILLQRSIISATDATQPGKISRVYSKLFDRIVKDEHQKNQPNPFGGVRLESLLYSLDWLLQTIKEIRASKPESDELLKSSVGMSENIIVELVKCRGDLVRESLEQLDLDNALELLQVCKENGRPQNHPSPSRSRVGQKLSHTGKGSHLAELVNNFAEAKDGPDQQVALVALCDFKKVNHDVDFEAHLSHLSPHFKEYLLDQVEKASKENSTKGTTDPDSIQVLNEMMKKWQLKVGKDKVEMSPAADQAASLRARLEALKNSKD